jgi:hypothetical protein
MCFTLCEERELFERFIRGYVQPSSSDTRSPEAHADLFGSFALAVDVPAARQIGILPATYYSPVDSRGQRYSALDGRPGLHLQMIQKLKELRDVSIVLAMIERSLTAGDIQLPSGSMLQALHIELLYQPEIVSRVHQLSESQRRHVFDLFNTDREPALDLVGFIDMMLSLYQETDSYLPGGSPMEFYQQREWRLIHHMRQGAVWYCLGTQPHFRNPLAHARFDNIRTLRRLLNGARERGRSDEYFSNCWVLEQVDEVPIREFISCFIVPRRSIAATKQIVSRFGCETDVVAAEEFGYSEE